MTLEIRTRTGVEVLRIEHLHRTTPADPFVVDVPPGRYRIAMSAPKDNATRDAFLVPNWREVTVRAAGWTEDWTVEHGGRCRVEIQGPVDWLLGGPLLLERPGYDTVMLQYDTAVGSVLSPILSPGDYTLRQRGGLVVAEVHITALQTVTVQVRRP